MASTPNFLDIDSDDDGIDDTREGWSTANYNPPTGIVDSDGDGITDVFESGGLDGNGDGNGG